MPSQQTPAHLGKLESVQILRAIAAGAVVLGHIMGAVVAMCLSHSCSFIKPQIPAGAGVDLFFAISGFIMVVASRRLFGERHSAREFLLRRVIRIVPLYWGVTSLAILLIWLGGRRELPDSVDIATSYLFFPHDTAGRGDGFAFPIVDLGWTLNYEMLFYVIFAAFIALGRTRCAIWVSIALCGLIGAGWLFEPESTALRFWSQPIMIEFAMGMWIGVAFVNGLLRLVPGVRWGLIVAAIAFLAINPLSALHSPTTPNDFSRVVGWGVPTAMALVAAISGPLPLRGAIARFFILVGDASYSLYLTHPLWILVVQRASGYWPGILTNPLVFLSVALLGSIAIAIFIHQVFERSATERLNRLINRRNASPPRGAAAGI